MSSEPMDWHEFQMVRRLLAEQRIGRLIRQAESAEDEAFNRTRRSLGGS